VVKFDLENTVEAVPKNWYCEKTSTCYWPPDACNSFTIEEKIKNQHIPDRSLWKSYPAVILGQYGTFCLLMIWKYEDMQRILMQLSILFYFSFSYFFSIFYSSFFQLS